MIVSLGMQSCRKDSSLVDVTPNTPVTGLTVNGSVIGIVTDQNGQAVVDAVVTYGAVSQTTDEYGVFQFRNTELYADGTYIKVEKDGFFKGSRIFYPQDNATSRIEIELIPMVNVATFVSSAGEKVQFEGVELAFSNNSIMTESGEDFNGGVGVYAKYLDPTSIATLNQMPGDLTAINANQERVALSTFGMIAVELRDELGNKLQVKTGSTVDLTMPVPADLLGNAPETIPLWHFDEEQGTWVEEGQATLENGSYVGTVSHFSYWNCDVPSDFVHLSGTVFNRGIPVEGVLVKITVAGGSASGHGNTNNEGVFGGFVPKDVELIVEVFDHCGALIYTTVVGPFVDDVVLDPFNLSITSLQAIVEGSVSSCEGDPSNATYVVIGQDEFNYVTSLDEDDSFQTNIFYCEEGAEIVVGAEDPINQLASANSTFTIEGNINVGNLELCEESVSQHLYMEYGSEVVNSFDPNAQDSLWNFTYSVQVINGPPQKEIYNLLALNWINSNLVYDFSVVYQEGVPVTTLNAIVPGAGFTASGEVSVQKISQAGVEYITVSGTLTDIQITDANLYDPSYTSLVFSMAVRI